MIKKPPINSALPLRSGSGLKEWMVIPAEARRQRRLDKETHK